uniref:ADP/ATP translocase n=1 Tax=Plectus sambesii TaxID=2011161 RepID=A0A914WLS4_9BILA
MASTSKQQDFIKGFFAGGVAGAVSKTAVAPIDRVKLVLQLQDASGSVQKCKGIIDCCFRISTEQGLVSFWRGNLVNVMKSFPQTGFSLALRDKYRSLFLRNVDKSKNFYQFVAGCILSGGAAGATTLCFIYPLDFARTRLAADMGNGKLREFKGSSDCITTILKKNGFFGLYRGFSASVQYIFVSRAAFFGMFDTCRSLSDCNTKTPFVSTWALAQASIMASGLFCYPWDTVRRRLMMQAGRQEKDVLYQNSLDCWLKICQSEGVTAFYKGAMSNLFRGTGSALVVAFYYEIIKYS